MNRRLTGLLLLAAGSVAFDQLLAFRSTPELETRPIDEIYKDALAEGGVVTCWHGGDEKNQQDPLKHAFEARFPGMTLNLTVNLSKYFDGQLDVQLANGNVEIDSIILQTLHDYPRWARDGALLNYVPHGFEHIWPSFKDQSGMWYGVYCLSWAGSWNTDKLPGIEPPVEFEDWLRPEFKDKLVLTYPHDDDAVLFAFYLVMQQYGEVWFESLLSQNPRWVRGSETPRRIISQKGQKEAATFTSGGGFSDSLPILRSRPVQGQFVSWPQTAAILKNARNPESAKLLHNYILSSEWQRSGLTWPVRQDIEGPHGFPDIMHMNGTNPTQFARFMADRGLVEKLKLYFEDRLGPPQGPSPLDDGI